MNENENMSENHVELPDETVEVKRRPTWLAPVIAAVAVVLVAGGLGGWYAWSQAQLRAEAQAAYDTEVAACQAKASAEEAYTSELVEARAEVAAQVAEATEFLNADPKVADDEVLIALASAIDAATASLETEPEYTTETCEVTPDEILKDTDVFVVSDIVTGISPTASDTTALGTDLAEALDAATASQLEAARASLTQARQKGTKLLESVEVTGEVKTTLEDAIKVEVADTATLVEVTAQTKAVKDATTALKKAEEDYQAKLAAEKAAAAQKASAGSTSTSNSSSSTSSGTGTKNSSSSSSKGSGTTSSGSSSSSKGSGTSSGGGSSSGGSSSGGSGSSSGGSSSEKPAPAPKPTLKSYDEWGGYAYSSEKCSTYSTAWADDIGSARATAKFNLTGQYAGYHIKGVDGGINITIYGCLK